MKKFGEAVWLDLLAKANLTHDFVETKNYDDEHIYTLLTVATNVRSLLSFSDGFDRNRCSPKCTFTFCAFLMLIGVKNDDTGASGSDWVLVSNLRQEHGTSFTSSYFPPLDSLPE